LFKTKCLKLKFDISVLKVEKDELKHANSNLLLKLNNLFPDKNLWHPDANHLHCCLFRLFWLLRHIVQLVLVYEFYH